MKDFIQRIKDVFGVELFRETPHPAPTIPIELDGKVIEVPGSPSEFGLPMPDDVPDEWDEITSLRDRIRRYKTRKRKA